MICLVSSVVDRGKDVFLLEERVIPENLFVRRTGGQQLQKICDPEAETTNARTSATLARFHRDSLQTVLSHLSNLPDYAAASSPSRSSEAVKYAQSGCWKTSALTLASGSIIMPSVSSTPISSGRSSFQIPC
jgi:hypothetical protein